MNQDKKESPKVNLDDDELSGVSTLIFIAVIGSLFIPIGGNSISQSFEADDSFIRYLIFGIFPLIGFIGYIVDNKVLKPILYIVGTIGAFIVSKLFYIEEHTVNFFLYFFLLGIMGISLLIDFIVWETKTHRNSTIFHYLLLAFSVGIGAITFSDLSGKNPNWDEHVTEEITENPKSEEEAYSSKNRQEEYTNTYEQNETTYQTTPDVIESTIDGEFEGFDSDKVYKLTNGQVWQQAEYKYKYSYKYRPRVTLVKSGIYYKMLVDGIDEAVKFELIGGSLGKTTKSMSGSSTPDLIESYITSDFSGFSNGNIYKLSNGQIWEQTEYYTYTYTYTRPSVMIYKTGGVYKLKFDNIDRAVTVKRIN